MTATRPEAENHLIVFVKNNRPGQVKTRIAAELGIEKAGSIYDYLCQQTRQLLPVGEETVHIYYSEEIGTEDMWDHPAFMKATQYNGTLGERMSHAFRDIFSTATRQEGVMKVLIIGTDCPFITPSLLRNAWHCLDETDLVAGPALDGGYYLLGMKMEYPELFDLPAWSTPGVLARTLEIADTLGLTYRLLPELSDIDTADDWFRYSDMEGNSHNI